MTHAIDGIGGLTFVTRDHPKGRARFEFLRLLGRGGMGVVYEVRDHAMGDRVALKALPAPDGDGVYALKREFRALARLVHPRLVTLFELIAHEGAWCFTMELVDGVDLTAWVRHDGRCDVDRLLESLAQLADGMSALHAAGVLHRDLKPSNVLVTRDGRVKILDFGLAQTIGAEQAIDEAESGGTLHYMSPEQMMREPLTPASDLYALGVMLHELLTGRSPFAGPPMAMLAAKLANRAPSIAEAAPHVPPALAALCDALLDAEPSRRPGADEIGRVVSALRGGMRPITGQHPAPNAPTSEFVGRAEQIEALRRAAADVAAGATVLVGVHGRSGSGKSALVERFLDELRAQQDAIVLHGRCYEQESVPYKGVDTVIDALSRLMLRLDEDVLESAMPDDVGLLAQLFPVLERVGPIARAAAAAPTIPDARELRRRAFAALRALLERAGRERLLVFSIDDLQWGDADSAALLAALLAPPNAPRLLLVAAYRSEYEDRSPCLAALLADGPLGDALGDARRTIEVGPLGTDDATRLAAQLLGDSPAAPGEAARIAAESGGSPYLLAELARWVREHADARLADRAPARLDDVLLSRVERLPDADRALVELLAVSGRPLRLQHARRSLDAGGVHPHLVARLRAGQLVRSTGPTLDDELELFHDRIRESVSAHLDAERRRANHAALARALDGDPTVDAETVAVHCEGAGDSERAGEHYARAADAAARALAFDRAAKLYRASLDLRPTLDDAVAATLRIALGHALANAGRGAEAADALLAASRVVGDGDQRTELLRLAAAQLCGSGAFERGMPVFADAMRRLGLSMPRTLVGNLAALVWRRARLELMNLERAADARGERDARVLRRVDMLWSVSTSVANTDFVRIASLQAQALLLALRAREPRRLALCLAWETVIRSTSGEARARRAQRLLDTAQRLADGIGDAHAQGMVQLSRGWTAFLRGRFGESLAAIRPAEAIFRDRCTGVAWELTMTRTMISWAHTHVGDTAGIRETIDAWEHDARDRSDLLLLTNLLSVSHAHVALVRDDAQQAAAHLDEALRLWPYDGFHVQHVSLLFSWARLHLYRGDAEASVGRFDRAWPALRRSLQLTNDVTRVMLVDLRARSWLAAAAQATGAERRRHLRAAERSARRMRKERAPWAAAYADRLEAGVSLLRGDEASAARALHAAANGFDAIGLQLDALATRRRYGQLAGGDAGRQAIAAADAGMRAREVRDLDAITRMLAIA